MAKKKSTRKYARNKDFAKMGNLAFYDGWNPNYVYFSSLANAGIVFQEGSSWNGALAGAKAASAISDAQDNINFSYSKESSEQYFYDRMMKIHTILHQAMLTERRNEMAFFKEKFQKLKKSFTPEEFKKIEELQDMKIILENGQTGFDYMKFIALINALMLGVENAQALAQYESKRIMEVKGIIDDLLKSRGKQVTALKAVNGKSLEEQKRAAEEAKKRLEEQIEIEYLEHGTLTRKTQEGKYAIFGGKTFEQRIDKPVSDVLAKWASDMLQEILNDPGIVASIAARLQSDYPIKTGNFSHLKEEVRQILITSIVQYGVTHLNTVLNQELDSIIVEEVEHFLTDEGNNIFDTVAKYNIHGIDGTLGKTLYESTFFDDAQTTADLVEQDAKQLFEQIRTLISKSNELEQPEKVSYLIRAMNRTYNNKGKTSLEQAEDIIHLIEDLERIQDHADELLIKWNKNKSKDDLIKTISVKSQKGKKIPITITIHNGEVVVDMGALTEAVTQTEGYQDLGFKSFNPRSLKQMLKTLKTRASKNLKESLIQAAHKMVNDQTLNLSEQELMSVLKGEMGNASIDITGPTIETLMPAIQLRQSATGNIMIDVDQKNKKVVVLMIKKNVVLQGITDRLKPKLARNAEKRVKFLDLKRQLKEAQEEFLYAFQTRCNETIKDIPKTSNSEEALKKKLDVAMVNMSRLGRDDAKLNEYRQKITVVTRKLTKFLSSMGIDHDSIEDLKKGYLDKQMENAHGLLQTLKNSFKVIPTIATSDVYVDDIGFTSDALGTSLDEQLSSLNQVFCAAGVKIKPKEMKWLRSAILNCFSGSIVGTANKNLIENYLGSLAAFALFDEGGVETAIISNFYKDYFKAMKNSMTSPKYIHLYIADGMYVPGSYVLQKTLNTIDEVLAQIHDIPRVTREGAGIEIINHASESMISTNRPMSEHLTQQNPNAWAITGKAVASQVQLKIVFLAGLLDIANAINDKLSTVQVPI